MRTAHHFFRALALAVLLIPALRLLQLNLFEKRDLMAFLRGDPPDDLKAADSQMALL